MGGIEEFEVEFRCLEGVRCNVVVKWSWSLMSTRGRGEMGAFQVDVFEESREFTRFKVELAEGKRDSFTGFQFGAVEESRREFTAFQVDVGEERRDLTEFQADTVEERGDFTFLEIPTGEPVGFMKPGVRYDDRTKVEACFQQTLQLMSVAIMDVASVKAFLGRWKVIENRLLQLPALVKEMSHLRSVSNNRVCSELLKVMEAVRLYALFAHSTVELFRDA